MYFSLLEEPIIFFREWVIVQKIYTLKVKLHAGRIILKSKTATIPKNTFPLNRNY